MSYGELMEHSCAHIAQGKGYDKMATAWPSDWYERAEEEINAMSNAELLTLLWEAEVLVVPTSE